ncbi:hypothetical protein [Archangium lansingense]|uniref:Lipoprotein n=1 Tax=Archangium lansingense TaxID=2995310 RepID=A0ABT3ZWD8_9BACT|nr:hypothetical protein [Archangium lansinium]MCY1073027.1 hypothetical protein [Archangium lansinium]
MPTKIAVTLLSSILLCGCSTTATISRVNGRTLDAKIRRSTPGAVVVQTDSGEEVSISRSDISDIDHPGNVSAVLGGLLGAYGVLNIAVGAPNCTSEGGAYCAGVFLPAALGASMLAWGLSTWIGSTSAASNSSSSGAVPDAPPASAFDFSTPTNGASASVAPAR